MQVKKYIPLLIVLVVIILTFVFFTYKPVKKSSLKASFSYLDNGPILQIKYKNPDSFGSGGAVYYKTLLYICEKDTTTKEEYTQKEIVSSDNLAYNGNDVPVLEDYGSQNQGDISADVVWNIPLNDPLFNRLKLEKTYKIGVSIENNLKSITTDSVIQNRYGPFVFSGPVLFSDSPDKVKVNFRFHNNNANIKCIIQNLNKKPETKEFNFTGSSVKFADQELTIFKQGVVELLCDTTYKCTSDISDDHYRDGYITIPWSYLKDHNNKTIHITCTNCKDASWSGFNTYCSQYSDDGVSYPKYKKCPIK